MGGGVAKHKGGQLARVRIPALFKRRHKGTMS